MIYLGHIKLKMFLKSNLFTFIVSLFHISLVISWNTVVSQGLELFFKANIAINQRFSIENLLFCAIEFKLNCCWHKLLEFCWFKRMKCLRDFKAIWYFAWSDKSRKICWACLHEIFLDGTFLYSSNTECSSKKTL